MQKVNFRSFIPRKKAAIAGGAALSVLLIYLIIRGCAGPSDVVYRFAKVTKGDVIKTVSVTGTLDVLNSYRVMSKINGVVNRVLVNFNQVVGKGQLLATVDSTEIDQEMSRVLAQLERARLDLSGAKADIDTKKDLYKENLISRKDLEQAELNYKKIAAQYRQFHVEYEIALRNKSYARIVSPASGVVISMDIKPMDVVSVNKPLFVIVEDLRKMYLTINVDESDIGKIAKGQSVTFTVSAFPGSVFAGKIDQVRLNPTTQQGIVVYQAIVICDNSEMKLKPGMTATATVVVGKKENVLRVHNEAFIVSPVETRGDFDRQFVWKKRGRVVDELPVKKIGVKTGLVGDMFTEIASDKIKVDDEVLVRIEKKFKL
ncbi:MAG TPA: efflux RND transporter periplasmic adaptor subunit [Spirochaetota bacterium]|nr:efflux RND transporter periplasmic adaptor subunit [Spirochaetota bacterium]